MFGHDDVLKAEHKLPVDVRGSKTSVLKLSNPINFKYESTSVLSVKLFSDWLRYSLSVR